MNISNRPAAPLLCLSVYNACRTAIPRRICFPFVLPASSLSRRLPPYSGHGQIPEENRPLERPRGSPAIAAARRAAGRQRLRLGEAVGSRGRGVEIGRAHV